MLMNYLLWDACLTIGNSGASPPLKMSMTTKSVTRHNCLRTQARWVRSGRRTVSDEITHEKGCGWVRTVCKANHAPHRVVRLSSALQQNRGERHASVQLRESQAGGAAFTKANESAFSRLVRLVRLVALGLRAGSPGAQVPNLGQGWPRQPTPT